MGEELKLNNVRGPSRACLAATFADWWRLQKEKEELDDLSTELELADEDEKIQYAQTVLFNVMRLASDH